MNSAALRSLVTAALVLAPALLAAQLTGTQEPGTKPETQAPAATTPSGHPDNAYWRQHDALMLSDFPWLAHFRDEDAKLGPPAPGEKRVVFMGDSITEGWHLDKDFPGKPYVNRGISGQTTPQMLLRFRQDVIHLQPKAVVLLAGTNDIAGNTGPETLEQIEDNLASMADLATANHIRVVLCSVLPAIDYWWQHGMEPAPKIDTLNAWIQQYATQKHYVYVDFHSAMKGADDGLPKNLSPDGVHPNQAGHAIMDPLVEAGIQKALKK